MIYDLRDTTLKGGAGMLGSLLASVTAGQEQIAWWAGVMVASASFASISFDIHRKWRNRKK